MSAVIVKNGEMSDETVFVVVSAPLLSRSAPVMEREGMDRVMVVVDDSTA